MKYIDKDSNWPQYMMFPRFLMEIKNLTDTDRIVYMLLLDRAKLSQKNSWLDDEGRVYTIFTIKDLAQYINKCTRVVDNSIKKLKEAELIRTKRCGGRGPAGANHIYVLLPTSADLCGTQTKKYADIQRKNVRGNNNTSNNDVIITADYSYSEGESL